MQISPDQALYAATRYAPAPAIAQPALLIAGATGVLGNAVLRRLSGGGRYAHTQVLAREPIQQGLQQISLHHVQGEPAHWHALAQRCDVAIVMFEPPRMFYERERALWTPEPAQLLPLAQWLRAQGARSLAVVLPHHQGTLPNALKVGLANLQEQAVASLGFDRFILLRSAEKPVAQHPPHRLEQLAHWMLSIFKFMVPAQEQPVRPSKLAELVDLLLQHASAGIHVMSSERAWQLTQMSDAQLADYVRVELIKN